MVHAFRHLVIHKKDIVDHIQELLIIVVRECKLWLNAIRRVTKARTLTFVCLCNDSSETLKMSKKNLNLRCWRIFRVCSKLWSYSIKHHIHPAITHVIIIFRYRYSLMNWLAVMNPHLITWHETDLAKVQWQRPLVLANRVSTSVAWTFHITIVC
jgi:hypothetical protein